MNEAKNILHVGNAVLTEDCIKQLEALQQNNNESLDSIIEKILKAIMYISLDPNNDDDPKIIKRKHMLVSDLALIIDELEDLEAPFKVPH